ncbi:uncharacterized protein EKO05_0000530 [Ascochyta rabiei]|uniref:uncharacterized protein n=1 Tax=Didymella rabiei TaxID=5454 RepID=UPI0019004EA6|nr:uncharacterized protein EKO05_0000530 [Ascochyta rabiei]UPX09849.1 hypothetical protein EKO05_0000530 [Ascochyta rabiei]
MSRTYGAAELHMLLPGPGSGHACLALYDVCPHTTHSSVSHARDPYVHQTLLFAPPPARSLERRDEAEGGIHTRRLSSTFSQHPLASIPTSPLARLVLSKHSPVTRSLRATAAFPPPPPPPPPAIYLLTFATDRSPSTRSFAHLLNTHLPAHIPLLYTIDARTLPVPPARLCAAYSGVAAAVQDFVLRDEGARDAVRRAVEELVRAACVDGSGGGTGGREVALAVCCTAGTHRSVAIAELVALGVRREVRRVGSKDGVKIVVRHVHRVRGVEDPY